MPRYRRRQPALSPWLLKRHNWDGVLVGNIDLLGLETLQPLIDAAVPILHHIGFVTPPFDKTHSNSYTLSSGMC